MQPCLVNVMPTCTDHLKQGHARLQAEREWYESEEGGTVDETHDPFVGDDKLFDKRAAEMQKKMVGAG